MKSDLVARQLKIRFFHYLIKNDNGEPVGNSFFFFFFFWGGGGGGGEEGRREANVLLVFITSCRKKGGVDYLFPDQRKHWAARKRLLQAAWDEVKRRRQ